MRQMGTSRRQPGRQEGAQNQFKLLDYSLGRTDSEIKPLDLDLRARLEATGAALGTYTVHLGG